MIRTILTMGLALSATALGAQATSTFLFDPVPRWQEEPELDEVCEVMRRECPAMARLTDIRTSMAYDEIFDVTGRLVGMRMTRSTGCRALDEAQLVGRREFRASFSREGEPDLNEDIRVELAPGVDPTGVRLVQSTDMTIQTGCG